MTANLITDVQGISVGHAHDLASITGVTVITVGVPNAAAVVVRGGAPGTRGLTILEPHSTGDGVDAIVLSGGSAFGLDAAGGVMAVLRDRGIGFAVGPVRVPIVAQAITFDLLNGGHAAHHHTPAYYWELGRRAALAANPGKFEIGSVGGGLGATTANCKGGLGSASTTTPSGFRVGAIAVVNAVGSVLVGDGPHFWAAPYEIDAEVGGLGLPATVHPDDLEHRLKGGRQPPPSTTIALVATDATLTKAQTKRIALMADDGLARAVRPAHAPMDGDTVFAVATAHKPVDDPLAVLTEIGGAAADCLARAIARGVYEATDPGGSYSGPPAYRDRFPSLFEGGAK